MNLTIKWASASDIADGFFLISFARIWKFCLRETSMHTDLPQMFQLHNKWLHIYIYMFDNSFGFWTTIRNMNCSFMHIQGGKLYVRGDNQIRLYIHPRSRQENLASDKLPRDKGSDYHVYLFGDEVYVFYFLFLAYSFSCYRKRSRYLFLIGPCFVTHREAFQKLKKIYIFGICMSL